MGLTQRLRQLLPRGAFALNVVKLAGGAAIGQALTLAAAPVLTRLYSPDDFGVLAVYVAIVSLLIVIANLRYEVAIPLPKEDRAGAALLLVALGSAVVISLLSGLALWLLRERLAEWTRAPEIVHFIWLMPLGILGAAVYNALNYWQVRRGTFSLVARTRIARSIAQVTVQLGLGALRLGPLGLLLGYVAGQFSGNGSLGLTVWRGEGPLLRTVTLPYALSVARRYQDFPLLATWAALLNIAPKQAPGLLLAALYGLTPAGLLDLSQRVIRVPMTMLSTSISQVYMNRAAEVARTNLPALPRLFWKAAGRLLALGSLPALLLLLTAPWLTSVAFGGQWREAGVYIQLVTPALLLEFIVSTLSPIIYVVERQGWQVGGDVIRFTLILGAFYLAYSLSADPRHAVAAYSAAMVVTYLGFFALYAYAVQWRVRVGFPPEAASPDTHETPA